MNYSESIDRRKFPLWDWCWTVRQWILFVTSFCFNIRNFAFTSSTNCDTNLLYSATQDKSISPSARPLDSTRAPAFRHAVMCDLFGTLYRVQCSTKYGTEKNKIKIQSIFRLGLKRSSSFLLVFVSLSSLLLRLLSHFFFLLILFSWFSLLLDVIRCCFCGWWLSIAKL